MIKMKDLNNSFFQKRWTTLAIIYSLLHLNFIFNLSFTSPVNYEVKKEIKHHFSNILNYHFNRTEQNNHKSSPSLGFFPWFIENLSHPRLFFYNIFENYNFSSNKLSTSFLSVNRSRAPPLN